MPQLADILALSVFYEVAAILTLATALGLVGLALRQPLIVAYIAVGILAGPAILAVAKSTQHVDLLSGLGVTLLLFLVGLKLDLHLIRTLGAVALATGLGQIAFTSIVGLAICLWLGMNFVTSVYVAVALTFSSTIIIVKLLTDKREIDSLHGRIALGFLIVQDIVVVLALAVLSAVGLGTEQAGGIGASIGHRLGAVTLLLALAVGMWFIADTFLSRVARSPDLLVTFAIGWAALLAALGDYTGLGKELGGLVAGISLSSSSIRDVVAGRLTSVREFLLLFFFIGLGAHFDLGLAASQIGDGLVLSVFVLVGNPLIVMIIMGAMGYRKRTGFFAGLTVAQISEFSLILVAMGLALGHVTNEALGLVTLVGVVTIALSTYMIYYSHHLYAAIEPLLGLFERGNAWREPVSGQGPAAREFEVVIFGLGRYGSAIGEGLVSRGRRVLGVDFDPEVVRAGQLSGFTTVFGDATDPDIWNTIPLGGAKWAICAVPALRSAPSIEDPRAAFLKSIRASGFVGNIAVAAQDADEAREFGRAGADLVLLPFEDAAEEAIDLITGIKEISRDSGDRWIDPHRP